MNNWLDPRQKIWGFHVHQELPRAEFAKALVIQSNASRFLKSKGIPIDNDDAIKPGYGPHLDYMWELRVESVTENVLEKMGLAISYMMINRSDLSAYLHPLMHDPNLPDEEALATEGRENQNNALWFSYRVPQNQDFFFNPPKDHNNQILDTRTSRILCEDEKKALIMEGMKIPQVFLDPYQKIINGFHIHMDFQDEQKELALMIFDNFLLFLSNASLYPTSTRIYAAGENGPHLWQGWEVKFETSDPMILTHIGIAIGWLMCNRKGLSVFMHPVTWEEGDHIEELKAHKEYSFFLGEQVPLDLSFFSNKINAPKFNYQT
ncbi:MAG: DOPA 4,5-dioxygenase family protein [Gammaproteobacteria bacterium]